MLIATILCLSWQGKWQDQLPKKVPKCLCGVSETLKCLSSTLDWPQECAAHRTDPPSSSLALGLLWALRGLLWAPSGLFWALRGLFYVLCGLLWALGPLQTIHGIRQTLSSFRCVQTPSTNCSSPTTNLSLITKVLCVLGRNSLVQHTLKRGLRRKGKAEAVAQLQGLHLSWHSAIQNTDLFVR